MIRVLVASSSPVVRAGLQALLAGDADLAAVEDTGDLDRLAELVEEVEPDVLLLDAPPDVLLPIPLALAADAAARAPAVVLLDDHAEPGRAAAALRAGARALLPRTVAAETLRLAILAAAAGLVLMPAAVADDLLPARTTSGPEPARAPAGQPLSAREREVLALLAEGLGNKGVAGRLGISEHTAKAHVAAILAKLHVATRAEAVAAGVRQGLLLL
mgnify:CR=1 FL=1